MHAKGYTLRLVVVSRLLLEVWVNSTGGGRDGDEEYSRRVMVRRKTSDSRGHTEGDRGHTEGDSTGHTKGDSRGHTEGDRSLKEGDSRGHTKGDSRGQTEGDSR